MAPVLTKFILHLLLLTLVRCSEVSYLQEDDAQPHCTYFNNRPPKPQPELQNCTWYSQNSCCTQGEIYVTFKDVKPFSNASPMCTKYLNYLMCYICSPDQNSFFQNERLTVCESYCDSFLDACKNALFKGKPLKDHYSNGKEFCLARRYLVADESCFIFTPAHDVTSKSNNISSSFQITILIILFYFAVAYNNTGIIILPDNVLLLKGKPTKRKQLIYGPKKALKSTTCYNFLFIIVFASVISTVAGSVTSFNESEVKQWASDLSQDFSTLAENVLHYKEFEAILSQVEYTEETVNITKEVLAIRKQLINFFSDKQEYARSLAQKVQVLYDSWEPEFSNVTNLMDLPMSVYKDADFLTRLPLNELTYIPDFNREVLLTSSVVKIADSVNRKGKDVIDTVQWSAELDLLFIQHRQLDPDIRWQYFGSTTGVQRSYPGREWKRNFIGFTEDFDPRSRPWFLSAISGPKDVVIIIDSSLSMEKNNRMIRMKESVKWILDTLTKLDRVNVVFSRSSYYSGKGEYVELHAEVVGCQTQGLIQATVSSIQKLWAAVEGIEPNGGSDHNEAFDLAFTLLRQDTSGGYTPCQRTVVLVTDGDIRDGNIRCSKGYNKHYHDGTKEFIPGRVCEYKNEKLPTTVKNLQYTLEQKASIITIFLDSEVSEKQQHNLAQMACQNNGIISKVYDDSQVFESLTPYFQFLKETVSTHMPLWTTPYLDKSGLGLMMTVYVPVYSQKTTKFIGVVGIDVPLVKIERILQHSVWGDTYAFMVDRNDLAAIIHPFAKPTAQLQSDPIFPPVIDLETHANKPADFTRVMSGIMDAGTGMVRITKDARRPVSTETATWWNKVDHVTYVYTDLPGSDFSVVLNVGPSDKTILRYTPNATFLTDGNFLSHMDEYLENGMTDVYDKLQPSRDLPKYKGIEVTTKHSLINLAPRSFCNPDLYLKGQPNFTNIHTFINSNLTSLGTEKNCDEHGVMYKPNVRMDVGITQRLENSWISRSTELTDQILWTFIGTANGVIRAYPGAMMKRDYDPTSRLWYRRTQGNDHIDLSLSKIYTDVISELGKVVTISKPIHWSAISAPTTCTDTSKADGCPCDNHQQCLSRTCTSNVCRSKSLLAVLAMDMKYGDFEDYILSLGSRHALAQPEHYCGMNYSCGEKNCSTRCYIVTDAGRFTYADKQEQLSGFDNESLPSQYGYIFRQLLAKGVYQLNKRLDYQGVCYVSNKDVQYSQSSLDEHQHHDDPSSGPIPLFDDTYNCIQEITYYRANTTIVDDPEFVVSGSLDDDPCGNGVYYLTTIPGTNTFLMVLANYTVEQPNLSCTVINNAHRPGNVQVNNEVCSVRREHVKVKGTRSCQVKDISLPCSNAAKLYRVELLWYYLVAIVSYMCM